MAKPIPACGRIIHVQMELSIPCWPAIVTGVTHKPNQIFATVFSPGHAAELVVLPWDSGRWHWPGIHMDDGVESVPST